MVKEKCVNYGCSLKQLPNKMLEYHVISASVSPLYAVDKKVRWPRRYFSSDGSGLSSQGFLGLGFGVDYAAFSICHPVEFHSEIEAVSNTQQVYLPPLLKGKLDHQAGPELFLPLASVMEDDHGSMEFF